MTVSTAYDPLSFAGNGTTTAFSVTWPFFSGSLLVTLISSAGVETVKTISTHYTVSGGTDSNGLPATGTVTMLTAPASGETLRIERVTPRTQATTYTTNDAFPAKTTEAAFDKLHLLMQEVLYETDRAIKLRVTDREAGVDPVLPLVTDQGGEAIIVNSDEDGVDTISLTGMTLAVGTVTTGAAGTDAEVDITGTAPDFTLDFTIPRGNTGASGAGSGDVVGPGSATDTAIVRYDGTTGTLLQDSVVTVADATGTIALTVSDSGTLGTGSKMWGDLFLASGGSINWATSNVVITHAANFLVFDGGSSGYSFNGGPILPQSNDGVALGTGALSFSDLFLASGGVINWNNGDVTLTHSSNLLALGGATGGFVPSSDNEAALGSATLSWADLFLASGAVINFDDGDLTITHSSGKITIAGTIDATTVLQGGSAISSGSVVSRAYGSYATSADLTTVIPLDDTIPQITEGTEVVTAAITPSSASNRVRATFTTMVAGDDTNTIQYAVAALFRDATANAIYATAVKVVPEVGADVGLAILSFVFEHVPGTTSSTTYRVRVGPDAGDPIRLNGTAAARLFGGVAQASLVLEEIVP
jgi:hypothetical protein